LADSVRKAPSSATVSPWIETIHVTGKIHGISESSVNRSVRSADEHAPLEIARLESVVVAFVVMSMRDRPAIGVIAALLGQILKFAQITMHANNRSVGRLPKDRSVSSQTT